MRQHHLWLVLLGITTLGCVKPTTPPLEPLPVATPTASLEKTHGELTVGRNGSLLIQYKDIVVVADPAHGDTVVGDRPIDYVLLTDERFVEALVEPPYRKSLKTICTPSALPSLQQKGYINLKALSSGQRVYLKKNENFLFVSAVVAQGLDSSSVSNSYLLEFDNGRNLLVGGRTRDIAPFREFVYSLRDDGREVYLALLPGVEADFLAEQVILIQPQFSLALNAAYLDGKPALNIKQIQKTLADQMYSGVFSAIEPEKSLPF